MTDIERLVGFSAATIHEAMGGRGALPAEIKPISLGMRVLGPAFPLASPPGDNLMLHHALAEAPPGCVLVADAKGYMNAGCWGDIMTLAAITRGIAGLVFYGSVRDRAEIVESGFPVFASGVCIRGTSKDKKAPLGVPILVGDVTVHPGDIVVGDDDGVVVVPRDKVEEVVVASQVRVEKEAQICERISNGEHTLDVYSF